MYKFIVHSLIIAGLLAPVVHVLGQENSLKIILLKEEEGQDLVEQWLKDALASTKSDVKLETIILKVAEKQDDIPEVCNAFSQGGSIILDLTWSGNDIIRKLSKSLEVPYIRIDASISPFLTLMDRYLDYRNSTDVALIFDNVQNIDQALYFWIDSTRLRMVLTETLDKTSTNRLKKMRPTPNNFVILADTANMSKLFDFALQEKLVTLPERWNLVFLDFKYRYFNKKLVYDKPINLLTVGEEVCCYFLNKETCECPDDFILRRALLNRVIDIVVRSLNQMVGDGVYLRNDITCDNSTIADKEPRLRFMELLKSAASKERFIEQDNLLLRVNVMGNIEVGGNYTTEYVAKYEDGVIEVVEGKTIKPIKAFYRIGITHAKPWSYQEKDETTGELYWTGYCADFARMLGEVMNFDFEFVEPKKGTVGEKRNGVWDGVVGDLAIGETDIAVTTIIMTADREEVIDFVAPYFEQTGISIVMRKPVRKTSLFKFMTVLKLEVWLCIVAALVVTGFMVWFLDRYSPYSAKNNKKAYPYYCRDFTLKESFWFALTSFTPQGGGEAPKALSGRTLVAAYWLFVVLMLATFTANLAAFLTVERMQTPVQSLEQLAKQSRINYTVVKESDIHQYFINMKNAEDILYTMWKELTLNASTDDTQYRVWDYPIREQYGHILLAINDSNPVANASEGFKLVNEHLDGDFAFIHDSSEIKYEISRNCNLTEVGDIFAERPYAVAVQQGSHIQDDISRAILKLQKNRFFERLQDKYWNHSMKGSCAGTDDSEGITLESLGGVFIATLFGLALAMITLAGEVIYYRKKQKNKKTILDQTEKDKSKGLHPDKLDRQLTITYPITIGTEFKPVKMNKIMDLDNHLISNLSLYPRARNRVTQIET